MEDSGEEWRKNGGQVGGMEDNREEWRTAGRNGELREEMEDNRE